MLSSSIHFYACPPVEVSNRANRFYSPGYRWYDSVGSGHRETATNKKLIPFTVAKLCEQILLLYGIQLVAAVAFAERNSI